MKPGNLKTINQSFEIQADQFESKALQFTKQEYLDHTVESVRPCGEEAMLEVAAGTCVCGRSFAPYVRTVVCLDATNAMLEVGRREAEISGLKNMVFVRGYVEELPFLGESFDIVFSRLAFHHFTDPEKCFSEMARCLRTGGRLVMIDMEAAREDLRLSQDTIETLRDPSHVRNLSRSEMLSLFSGHGLRVEKCETKKIRQELASWMALTKTPETTQEDILRKMEEDLSGGEKTGFYPYVMDGKICFDQRWVLTIGIKP